MKIRMLAFGFMCAACLCGQHQRFSWQEARFQNPGLPYCAGHEFAVRPTKNGATPNAATSPGTLQFTSSAVLSKVTKFWAAVTIAWQEPQVAV
jgi:hypothetical protein